MAMLIVMELERKLVQSKVSPDNRSKKIASIIASVLDSYVTDKRNYKRMVAQEQIEAMVSFITAKALEDDDMSGVFTVTNSLLLDDPPSLAIPKKKKKKIKKNYIKLTALHKKKLKQLIVDFTTKSKLEINKETINFLLRELFRSGSEITNISPHDRIMIELAMTTCSKINNMLLVGYYDFDEANSESSFVIFNEAVSFIIDCIGSEKYMDIILKNSDSDDDKESNIINDSNQAKIMLLANFISRSFVADKMQQQQFDKSKKTITFQEMTKEKSSDNNVYSNLPRCVSIF